MEYQLRAPASAGEWDAYHSIREAVLWVARGRVGEYDRDHPDEHVPGHHPLILVHERTPIGVVRIDVAGGTAWLRRVAIRQDLQRRGHGRVLLQLAERFARERGCRSVRSNVDAGAVEFYLKCGYALDAPGSGAGVAMLRRL